MYRQTTKNIKKFCEGNCTFNLKILVFHVPCFGCLDLNIKFYNVPTLCLVLLNGIQGTRMEMLGRIISEYAK
jgi:hypothetical protein